MALYKIDVIGTIYTNQGQIPTGASVEALSKSGCTLTPDEAKEAFKRKYGKCPSTDQLSSNCKWEILSY